MSEDKYEIEKAGIENLNDVVEIALKLWDYSTYEELERDLGEYVSSDEKVTFLVLKQKVVTGFALCSLRHDYVEGTQSSPVGYLEGIYMDEKARRQGIATRLVKECEDWAKTKGCVEFGSDIEEGNDVSLAFHLSAGFQEANRIICMCKRIE